MIQNPSGSNSPQSFVSSPDVHITAMMDAEIGKFSPGKNNIATALPDSADLIVITEEVAGHGSVALQQGRKFGLLTRADVADEPSSIPLIHGLIAKGQLTMIAGPSGSGKSTYQLHLGAALVNADEVFGHSIPKRSRFLYVNLEGELKQRLEAIERHHSGWSFPAPAAMFLTRPWSLNDRDSVESLAHHVNQVGGVDVVFIDTLNRAMPGSDENLSTDMGVVIANATLLINLTGAAVVLTHHTGKAKDRGPRGHSSLYAALDTCLMVDQAESGIRIGLKIARSVPRCSCRRTVASPERGFGNLRTLGWTGLLIGTGSKRTRRCWQSF